MLSSSIMEETGGLGVDYIIDNGGKWGLYIFLNIYLSFLLCVSLSEN